MPLLFSKECLILSLLFTEPITDVNVKPSLAQPIANQALKLTCEVLGSQTVSSRLWLKDGQPLSTSDKITLSVDSSVVSFNPVLQSDNGQYQCKASNPLSEVTSAGYRLEVIYGPEQASITAPHSGAKGSSITFTCLAQSLPPCHYTWYFNETETAHGSQFEIASVSNADSGSYTCVAWNSVTGRNTSAVKEFIASVPISNVAVTQSSPDLAIAGSTAVNLTCEVSGLGVADSRLWMMDGQPLSNNDRITLSADNSTVSFNPVLLSDNGAYQCTASNPVSSQTSDAYRLVVNCKYQSKVSCFFDLSL
ncbi:carcinoembryonic antigen-related cell adhesion molecule 20-like [Huso huso]|uniref:Carcinoembryonic antigen-related cell adhesion molecule 20-like n=1 Tax=Huso huso TaxID=61971 RepID=A0ABR0YAY2_HUSHU